MVSMDNWQSFSPNYFHALFTTLLLLIAKAGLFYTSFLLIINPMLMDRAKTAKSIWMILVLVFIGLMMERAVAFYIIFPYIYKMSIEKMHFFNISGLVFTLLDLLIPVFLLCIYELIRFSRSSRQRENRLEKEKLISELNFLKAQMNPHFLFNVLSTVHALSRNKAPEAADVALKLSQLMRYMLYEAKENKVPITKEIKILEDYVDLERVRFSNKLTVNFIKDIDDDTQYIAPLILLPFLENAFKHGSSENVNNSFVNINLKTKDGRLDFNIENSIEEHVQHEKSSQVGLSNVKRQLELIYPQHHLQLEKKEKSFSVHLKLNFWLNEKI